VLRVERELLRWGWRGLNVTNNCAKPKQVEAKRACSYLKRNPKMQWMLEGGRVAKEPVEAGVRERFETHLLQNSVGVGSVREALLWFLECKVDPFILHTPLP